MKTVYFVALLSIALSVLIIPAHATSTSAEVGFGHLFYNDTIVRTVVVPAALPNGGIDNFYEVTNGASGQLGITAVAPGSADYHGGAWKVFHVTFISGSPVLLRSASEVLTAQAAHSVTVVRVGSEDFRCPVQP